MKTKKRGEYTKLINGVEDNTLLCSASGHGKGLFGERIIYDFFCKGETIIGLPSHKLNMELGYAAFLPEKDYHKKGIKFQQEKPKSMNVKFYHFTTPNFPSNRELAPHKILSMDIKKFKNRLLCYYLFEEFGETGFIRLFIDEIHKLKNNEGIFDLVKKINESIKKTESFGVEAKAGDRRHLNRIVQVLERFRYNPLIFQHDCEFNLDMKQIIKDQKHYHIFSSRYISDVKNRDLITLYLLLEIIEAKQKNPNLPPVCVFMDEIKALCPSSVLYEFKKPLNKIIGEILSTCRGLEINIVATSQNYTGIADEVRGAFNNVCIGKITDLKDLGELSQVIKIDRNVRQEILGLNYNEFFVLNLEDGIDEGSFLTYFAPHCHCERNYNFDRMYKQKYPQKIRKHKKILSDIAVVWKKSQT